GALPIFFTCLKALKISGMINPELRSAVGHRLPTSYLSIKTMVLDIAMEMARLNQPQRELPVDGAPMVAEVGLTQVRALLDQGDYFQRAHITSRLPVFMSNTWDAHISVFKKQERWHLTEKGRSEEVIKSSLRLNSEGSLILRMARWLRFYFYLLADP